MRHGTIDAVTEPRPSPPPSSARGARYQRSIGGMVGALIITLLAVGAFVGFRALNRDPLEVTRDPVDYLPVVAELQRQGDEPVYPSRLPDGWVATSVDLRQGATPSFGVGMVTDADTFVGVRHGGDTLDGLLATYVDESFVEGEPATVETEVADQWRTFSDDGGDRAYAAEVGGLPLLVYGTADDEDLRTMLGLLTTAQR